MAAEVVNHEPSEKPKETHSYHSVYHVISDYSLFDKDVTSLEIFERVLSAVNTQDSQVLKPAHLKELYLFFVYLSDLSRDWSKSRGSDYVGIRIQKFSYTVKFSDIFNISSFLFGEFSRSFKLGSVIEAIPQSSLHSESWDTQEGVVLLLRCCMVTLHLLEVEPSILWEKCRGLLTILRKLCSPDLSFEHSDSRVPFICSVLEVFVDELLVHRQLRQYFILVDDVSFTNEKLFNHHMGDSDSDAVLEVISAHFILSVRDECMRKKVLGTSIWRHCEKAPRPELSLTAAMQLLGTPVMVSAPCAFQAYLISMVSRCMGIDRASDDHTVDEILKIHYISAFEKSSIMYARHMSHLKLCGHQPSVHSGSTSCDESFESYLRPATYNGINQVTNFADYCPNFSFKSKSMFLSASDAFMKENEQILNKFYKDEILSALNSIVSRILFAKVEAFEMHTGRDVSEQETYLLAFLMNLMSNSLLQMIRCMQGGSLGCQKTMKDHTLCKEYDVIIGIIGCLLQYIDSHSAQKLLKEVMGSNPTSHKESKLMIMHFASFLPFCYHRGHKCLWKGCIFTLMTLMNLIIFEDGNLEAFKSLSSHSTTNPSKVSSSSKIASKFQNFRKLHLRGSSAKEDDSCNGERYLKLFNVQQSDIDDLADFVECKKEKDYPKYLKNRRTYLKWKNQKTAVLKRNRRNKTRKLLNGIKTKL